MTRTSRAFSPGVIGILLLGNGLAFAAPPAKDIAEAKPAAHHGSVADCFRVQALVRMDEEHYWADWKNGCSFTIDSVYVVVSFVDRAHKPLGEGVWSLHDIGPGHGRVTRLSTPPLPGSYETVSVRRVTSDAEQAFQSNRARVTSTPTVSTVSTQPSNRVVDSGEVATSASSHIVFDTNVPPLVFSTAH